jgi:hypothetical protein
MSELRRALSVALLLVPGALTIYFGFHAGGFFPGTQGFVAVVLTLLLILRLQLAGDPFGGASRLLAVAGGSLALFAVWVLLSDARSDSAARALIEFNRAYLYLLAFLLFGSLVRTSSRLRLLMGGLLVGMLVVAGAGLATRVLPDVFPTSPNLANNRLSYPVTYWNTLGLVASLGFILGFSFTSRLREPAIVRVAAAGSLPVFATALLFTFSRGAIAAGLVGLLAYAVVGRPRALISALLASVPPTALAVVAAYDADLLATDRPTTAAATAQGHDVAVIVALAIALALALRAALLVLDRQISTRPALREAWRRLRTPLAVGVVVAAAIAAILADAPSTVSRQYDRFAEGDSVSFTGDFRQRLTNPGNSGRLGQWEIALDDFSGERLAGRGAATYQLAWDRERPTSSTVVDAHSLYVEVLGELGIVGFVLLVVALGAVVGAAFFRSRRANRAVYGAVFAMVLTWALHAGVDWDWETPAVTLWLFAVGGIVLAASPRGASAIAPPGPFVRAGAAAGLLALALVPLGIARSQDHLDRSSAAFARQDCQSASREARAAIDAVAVRPEPYETLAYCAIRRRRPATAVRRMRQVVALDPRSWNSHYSLAVARAAAGRDPRPAARRALRMNPRAPLTRDLIRRFREQNRKQWVAQGRAVADAFASL